jgi:hypothetical protein
LIQGLDVVLISGHVGGQPLLGAADILGVIRARQVLPKAAPTTQGLRSSEKPGLELPMSQNDPDRDIGSGSRRPLEKEGAELRRAVIVAVEEDQDAAVPACTPRSQLHGALQLSFFEELVSPHPERMDLDSGLGKQRVCDPPHKDRDGFEVALTFDDTG